MKAQSRKTKSVKLPTLSQARGLLRKYADSRKAVFLQRFFKAGKGQYGYGDKFIGVVVPDTRKVAQQLQHLPLSGIKGLLQSKIHEERLLGLIILNSKFFKGGASEKKEIFEFYLKNIKNINNWDLVDSSAHFILGGFLFDKDRALLYKLAVSDHLWSRRMAMIATYHFIRKGEFSDTLKLAKILMKDQEDLMHKAVGWMLREIGKRDFSVLDKFVEENASHMPRTMLRYAIEKFPEKKRKKLLTSSKQKPKTALKKEQI